LADHSRISALEEPALDPAPAQAMSVLAWAYSTFPRLALVSSFQAESSVLIDMATRISDEVRVVTIDTGRLPQETHDVLDRMRQRYGLAIEVISPDSDELSRLTRESGTNLFYRSPELRRSCCDVRKVQPLKKALQGYDAWITGVRRAQTATRATTPVVSADPLHPGLTKIAPLAQWSRDQVWDYIREHRVPYHSLYDLGYTSIGCAPCTRATQPGEDERAGRWWWESGESKECGMHWAPEGA
jgi:phosphoadenosine phosphosulfate reductase